MTAYEQAHNAYREALKNNFWDAWGIVAAPKTIYRLRAECMEHIVVYRGGAPGGLERLFNLVLIPCSLVEEDKMYVVDEFLGRRILGQTGRSE